MQAPLDGEVVWGSANVSLAHISGESQPVRVAAGSALPAGALNYDGLLAVRVSAASSDSTPARIARMAAEARVGWGGAGRSCMQQANAHSAPHAT